MQTELSPEMQQHPKAKLAADILQRCVHCGFCTATCPTYQLLGDENDGPRGRIYLIKQVLEGHEASRATQQHLDRCLTCRNCETTCPSGVEYVKLLEIGKQVVDEQVGRSLWEKIMRKGLVSLLPNAFLFASLMKMGRIAKPFLPSSLKKSIPDISPLTQHLHAALSEPQEVVERVVLARGCVQNAIAPDIYAATRYVLSQLGIAVIDAPDEGCCGAIRLHLDEHDGGVRDMQNNIVQWTRALDAGASFVVSNASGCGLTIKQYGEAFAADPEWAQRAERISKSTLDVVELIQRFKEPLRARLNGAVTDASVKLSWHAPCTLQHGQQLSGAVESLFAYLGIPLKTCRDAHLCCGSAGTYSILQSKIARQLRDDKLKKLDVENCDQILSANIGCQSHLQTGTEKPVHHWIVFLAQQLHNANMKKQN